MRSNATGPGNGPFALWRGAVGVLFVSGVLGACGGGGGSGNGSGHETDAGGGSTGGSTGGGQPPPMGVALAVPAAARACEVRLLDEAGRLGRVAFHDGTRGQWLRRGGRVALAFVSTGGAIADGVVGLELELGPGAGEATPDVESATCFGENGQPLPASDVRVVTGGAP